MRVVKKTQQSSMLRGTLSIVIEVGISLLWGEHKRKKEEPNKRKLNESKFW